MSESFAELSDAINDERFVEVDLALRRGQHVDRDDADAYAYLLDARGVLEPFYNRYSCELVHRTDGYFFLLPLGDKVPKRLLGIPEMIVGQAAALLYLDPSTIERGGVVTREDILSHLAAIMGTDALVAAFNPKRKRMDERVAQETVRQRTTEALRKLSQLGFVSQLEEGQLRLRGALMRFADPVRGAGSTREALEKLIARGEVAIPEDAANEAENDELDAGDTSHETSYDDSGAHDSGLDDSGLDDGGLDDSGLDDSGLDDSALDDSALDDSALDDSALDAGTNDNAPEGDDEGAGASERSDRSLAAKQPAKSSHADPFTDDSEFPPEPDSNADDAEDDYFHDTLMNDVGEPLAHDDAAESEEKPDGKRRKSEGAKTTSAEWDPTFDDFD